MNKHFRTLFAASILFIGLASAAYADGLPPAPNGMGGGPSGKASTRGESGGALEPYLITLLLPVGGIVMAAAGIGMDKRLRAAGHG